MELNYWGNFWPWGSLRPWQILHSKLAHISHSNEPPDLELWQLLHSYGDDTNRNGSEYVRGEVEPDSEHGLGMKIEDLESAEWMWRYGGLKLSEWLEMRQQEEWASEAGRGGEESEKLEEESESESERRRRRRDEEAGSEEWYIYTDEEGDVGEATECGEIEVRMAVAAAAPDLETRYYREELEVAAEVAAEEAAEAAEEAAEECAVCLEKVEIWSEGTSRLACRHNFHSQCVSQWLLQRHRCPCCRASVNSEDIEAAALAAEVAAPPPEAASLASPSADLLNLVADMEAALDRIGLL